MHLGTPILSEMLAFELNADDTLEGLPASLASGFWTRHPWFPTRMSNLDSSDNRTLFHFETVNFKWALAHRTRRRFWTMLTNGFLFAWLSFSLHLQMARQIVYDRGFWKYPWAYLVMSMTESYRWVMQCRLRAQRPLASNKGLQPCPLRTEISPVSLNLLIMLYTVDDEICKAFTILCWGTLFFRYSTIFLCTLGMARYHNFGFSTIPKCNTLVSILDQYHMWQITSLKQ